MAGRGVDIVLGGEQKERKKNEWQKEHDKVLELGGLHVIGIERHESRRIDNQLRGRSGRQGDAGSSRFYVSLEDDIMRIFGGEQIAKLMTTLKMPEDVPLEHGMVSRAIEQAQVKVESFHFDSRKHLVDYDDVMNRQREIIYKKRKHILKAAENKKSRLKLKEKITQIVTQEIDHLSNLHINPDTKQVDHKAIANDFVMIVPFDPSSKKRLVDQLKNKSAEEINLVLSQAMEMAYKQREKQVGETLMREMERFVMLSTIDHLWIDHLDAIDDLREGIGLRGYAQRDPLVEYKAEAFNSFEKLVSSIDYEIARKIFRVSITKRPQPVDSQGKEIKPEAPEIGKAETKPDPSTSRPVIENEKSAFAKAFSKAGQTTKTSRPGLEVEVGKKKIGRNDPCFCGSGKKWKKCHYPDKG